MPSQHVGFKKKQKKNPSMNYMQSQIHLVDTIYCPPLGQCAHLINPMVILHMHFFVLQDFDAQGLQE